MITDVVIGLQHGDEGKGKVTHHLLKSGEYTHCVRFNGGCNAGHTIFHNGKKFVTHHIPAGVFFGVTSVIGNGCVIDPMKLEEEIDYLESHGIPVRQHLRIAKMLMLSPNNTESKTAWMKRLEQLEPVTVPLTVTSMVVLACAPVMYLILSLT